MRPEGKGDHAAPAPESGLIYASRSIYRNRNAIAIAGMITPVSGTKIEGSREADMKKESPQNTTSHRAKSTANRQLTV